MSWFKSHIIEDGHPEFDDSIALYTLVFGDLEVNILVFLSNFLESSKFHSVDFPEVAQGSGGTEETVVWVRVDNFDEDTALEFGHVNAVERGDAVDDWSLSGEFLHVGLEFGSQEIIDLLSSEDSLDFGFHFREVVLAEFLEFVFLFLDFLSRFDFSKDSVEEFLGNTVFLLDFLFVALQ